MVNLKCMKVLTAGHYVCPAFVTLFVLDRSAARLIQFYSFTPLLQFKAILERGGSFKKPSIAQQNNFRYLRAKSGVRHIEVGNEL